MAAAFDASSQASTSAWISATSPVSWTHVCTGSDLFLIVYTLNTTSGTTISGVTYNGVAMTNILTDTTAGGSNSFRGTIWGLVAPATGSHTVSVTFSSSSTGNTFCAAASYTGILQTTPVDASNTKFTSSNASGTVGITVNNGNEWVIGCTTYMSNAASDNYTNATKRGSNNTAQGGQVWDSAGVVGTGTYTVTANGGGTCDRIMLGISLKQIPPATNGNFLTFM